MIANVTARAAFFYDVDSDATRTTGRGSWHVRE
jgi:hypothetical protein